MPDKTPWYNKDGQQIEHHSVDDEGVAEYIDPWLSVIRDVETKKITGAVIIVPTEELGEMGKHYREIGGTVDAADLKPAGETHSGSNPESRMNPPRPNEGIDVEKEALRIGGDSIERKQIVDLVARVRLETEAVVTKRERNRCAEICIKYGESDEADCAEKAETAIFLSNLIVAAYESNDAGESRHG